MLAAPVAAATIRGTVRGDAIVGTPSADTITAGPGNDLVQAAWGGVDRVDCGGGRDIVSADATDRVSANCEVVSRRLSVDLSTNPASQHETAVEPDSFAWGSTVVAAYQVGRFANGGSSNIGTSVSTDAGRTWKRALLPAVTVESQPPGPESAASDPTVAYDAVHGVWLVGTLTIESNSSHVYVARSTDGLHWSAPVDAASGPMLDKDWIACDNNAASPYRGRCYAEFSDDAKNMTVSESSDDGGLTWSAPVKAYTILVGTQPVILPNGTLVVVAGDYADEGALTGSIASLRSTDGGATFTRATVSTLHAAPNGGMRAASLPSVDVDSAGTIYAAWHDCRFRPGCTVERHGGVDVDGRGDVERADPRADRADLLDARRVHPRARGRPDTPRPSRARLRVLHAGLVRARRLHARDGLHVVAGRRHDVDGAAAARRAADADELAREDDERPHGRRLLLDVVRRRPRRAGVHARDVAARRPLPRGDLRRVATRLADPPARAASRPRRRRSGRTRARRTASRRG